MPVTPDESRSHWATGRLLTTSARLIEQSWNARLRALGVSHAGLLVLHVLARGRASQRELAGSQYLTEQTIGRTLGHLESTGHIRRATDPADRRRRVVELTELGAELVEQVSDRGRVTDDLLIAAGVDVARFRAALGTLIDSLDAVDTLDAGNAVDALDTLDTLDTLDAVDTLDTGHSGHGGHGGHGGRCTGGGARPVVGNDVTS